MIITVVGTVAFDAIETPFGKTDKIIGGAGTYIGLSASYFTNKINMVSVVGDDFPQDYLDLLQKKNIDIEGIEIVKGGKSFFWAGKYHDNMNQRDTLVTELNVLADFDPKLPKSYENTDYLLLGNLSPDVQRKVIERIPNRPKLIAMDTMNFWMDIAWDELMKTIALVDVLIINDEEARQLSGEYSLKTAARKIMKLGPKYLIIKKGEHGALLFGEDKMFYAPALVLETVFDPTGAGDTFAGGFIGYLAKNNKTDFESMKAAVVAGSTLASFCVEKFGTEQLLDLSDEEINGRVNEFKALVSFEY